MPIPAVPASGITGPDSLGYWSALQWLLTYTLGWKSHGRGLRNWYDAGKPTDDLRLALVSEVWDRDGLLDQYLAWAHTDSAAEASRPLDWIADVVSADAGVIGPRWSVWLREIEARAKRASGSSYYQPHEQHLEEGMHVGGGIDHSNTSVVDATLSVVSRPLKLAVLTVPSMIGWYSTLNRMAAQLPPIGAQSWHVEVYTKTTGYLGSYRRSRQTGLWFTGKHRFHQMGSS
ncbi:hypothetical protein ACVXZ4_09990 [Lacisediminihabitans sp. FW035]